MSAEAYGLVGLACGIGMCVLLVIALLKAASEHRWERMCWEAERADVYASLIADPVSVQAEELVAETAAFLELVR